MIKSHFCSSLSVLKETWLLSHWNEGHSPDTEAVTAFFPFFFQRATQSPGRRLCRAPQGQRVPNSIGFNGFNWSGVLRMVPGRRPRGGCGLPAWGKRRRALEGAWASEKGRERCRSPNCVLGGQRLLKCGYGHPLGVTDSGKLPLSGVPSAREVKSPARSSVVVQRSFIPCSDAGSLCAARLFPEGGFPCAGVSHLLRLLQPESCLWTLQRGPAAAVGEAVFEPCGPGSSAAAPGRTLHLLRYPAPLLSAPLGTLTEPPPCPSAPSPLGRAGELGSFASFPVPDSQRMHLPWQVLANWHSKFWPSWTVLHKS